MEVWWEVNFPPTIFRNSKSNKTALFKKKKTERKVIYFSTHHVKQKCYCSTAACKKVHGLQHRIFSSDLLSMAIIIVCIDYKNIGNCTGEICKQEK